MYIEIFCLNFVIFEENAKKKHACHELFIVILHKILSDLVIIFKKNLNF